MRIAYAPSAFALLAGASVVNVANIGCNDRDAVPAYISTTYQVRCLDQCRSAQDDAVRKIFHVDGEEGFNITCSVGRDASGERQLSFRARCRGNASCGDERYGLEVTGIALDDEDGDPGNDCRVKVEERSNTFEGACTKDDPTTSKRCSVQFKVDADKSLVRGKVLCANVADENAPRFTRYVVSPRGDVDEPLSFTVQGCEGL